MARSLLPPPSQMNRRSRKGCIDCKRAKVKCDEVQPACGTCYRRGYVCQGYASTQSANSSPKNETRNEPGKRQCERKPKVAYIESSRRTSDGARQEPASRLDLNRSVHWKDGRNETKHATTNQPNDIDIITAGKKLFLAIRRSPELCPTLPSIPAGSIPSADESVLELYFKHHPPDQVLGTEFVDEMNSIVLKVFHIDPSAVSECLSAIGHLYSSGRGSLVPILDRRARILSKLRTNRDLEPILCMLLALCALEMIDNTTRPNETTLPVLIANTAMIMNHHQSTGGKFSFIAKYFIRALARQDMMIALTYSRPPLISHEAWLDEECRQQADRFMGYTVTLMPILANLSNLACAVRAKSRASATNASQSSTDLERNDSKLRRAQADDGSLRRAIELHAMLTQRCPTEERKGSLKHSENLLLHAYAYKAAALLYLHRLMNPHGIIDGADKIALSIAREILGHLSNVSTQLKTALWPLFMAASELADSTDRNTALGLFDNIFRLRKTVTTLRTKSFCIDRIWKARDSGTSWNWIDLVHQYPGECLPI